MDDPSTFPLIDRALLVALDKAFPERCPNVQWSDRKVWMEAGKREAIRFLIRVYDEQHPEHTYDGGVK